MKNVYDEYGFVENFDNMTNEQLIETEHVLCDLYIKYDKINDERNGTIYGIHEHFRTQIDMIADYMRKVRKMSQQQIDEMHKKYNENTVE